MNRRPIGVFDSGVGGLTVFDAVQRALPGESLVYLGDTARVPYGTRSPETVVRYSREAAGFLRDHAVKMLIVACNTASAVALPAVADVAAVPALGVILPGARRAVERSRAGRIGVIGTRATIDSGAYTAGIRSLRADAEIVSRACPLFVPLAEEGWTDNVVALETAETYLAPLRERRVDTLVLGCTHYPLLRETISRVMGPEVALVDSAEAVASEAAARLAADPALAATGPGDRSAGSPALETEHHFFVTDAPDSFQEVARRFLGQPIERLQRATLGEP